MSLLGLDVGTTGAKAAAFSEQGACLAAAYREYPTLHRREGWAELDSLQVLQEVKAVIAEVASATEADPITALSISAMGEAATPVEEDGTILGPCILSADIRGREYVEKLAQAIDREDLFAINPNILSASYTMPKLCWLRDHEPKLYGQAGRFLLCDGLVAQALGCEPFVSYSHANRTLLFDIHREDWSDDLLEICGIERRLLPRCLPGGATAGEVSAEAADQLGLPRGVQVVVGGHDQCCNALGAGITAPGRAVDGIGTYECITPVYADIPQAKAMLDAGLNVEHHVVPGLYVSFLFNQAGSLLRWFRDAFAAERRGEEGIYDALIAEIPPEPTGLFVLPYFEPTGSPGYVSDASGVILGLKTSTTRGEILKAIMESATYYFAESLDCLRALGIDMSEFIATGGGARSDAWLQIKADIYGLPMVRPAFTECGLLGAAILAGVATGRFEDFQDGVERLVRTEMRFEPDPGRAEMYRRRLDVYRGLFPSLREQLLKIHNLS